MEQDSVNPAIRSMLRSQRRAIVALLVLIGMLFLGVWSLLIYLVVVAFLCVQILLTWVFVFRAGNCEAGAGYAWRHLILSIVLTPLLFVGIVFVPLLVKSDLEKWRNVPSDV